MFYVRMKLLSFLLCRKKHTTLLYRFRFSFFIQTKRKVEKRKLFNSLCKLMQSFFVAKKCKKIKFHEDYLNFPYPFYVSCGFIEFFMCKLIEHNAHCKWRNYFLCLETLLKNAVDGLGDNFISSMTINHRTVTRFSC